MVRPLIRHKTSPCQRNKLQHLTTWVNCVIPYSCFEPNKDQISCNRRACILLQWVQCIYQSAAGRILKKTNLLYNFEKLLSIIVLLRMSRRIKSKIWGCMVRISQHKKYDWRLDLPELWVYPVYTQVLQNLRLFKLSPRLQAEQGFVVNYR